MISFFAFLSLVCLLVGARWPYLINAADMNSDHAIVGLQALHILRGEWQWLLWGCDYQASWEPLLAAGFFTVFGVSSAAILMVAVSASLVILVIYWRSIRLSLGVFKTWVLLVPLAVGSFYFIRHSLYPPRHWSVVAMVVGVYCLVTTRQKLGWFLSGLLPFLALYVDFFAIQFIVPYGVLAFFVLRKQLEGRRAFLSGAGLGLGLLLLSRQVAKRGAPLAFNPLRPIQNFPLLVMTCLPRMLGIDTEAWGGGKGIPFLGGAAYLALLTAGLRFLARRQFDSPIQKYGLFAWLSIGQSLVGFLGSSMAADEHAVRYLTPIFYVLPWALAPLMEKRWVIGVALAIGLLTLGHHYRVTHVHYPDWLGLTARGRADDEREMAAWLRSKKVTMAYSDYWDSYRLGFLFRENPPVNPDEKHRVRFESYSETGVRAFIRSPGTQTVLPSGETRSFGDYTVVVVQPKP